jgi:uncharacterized protein YoxC
MPSSKQASEILGRLDKIAEDIQTNHESWGMPFDTAKTMVNQIDQVADAVETMAFGEGSLDTRQREVLAQVLKRDADESYMQTFEKGQVVQSDSDEPYMSAYGDDESSCVRKGRPTVGAPLTKG